MKIRVYQETVICERTASVAMVTINHPPVNVLNRQVLCGLKECFDALTCEKELRCVIVTGTGASFIAGGDIREFQDIDEMAFQSLTGLANELYCQIEGFFAPVIAAVNGYAFGGGLELALACDIRLAADSARMSLPEASVGMIPSYGGTARLAKLIGPGLAKYMIFTGERISARRAMEIGLVQQVTSLEALLPLAEQLALEIAGKAPIALREIKAVINAAEGATLEEALSMEAKSALTAARSADMQEGVTAFLEKRPPAFRNK